jgi:hypothetical protein
MGFIFAGATNHKISPYDPSTQKSESNKLAAAANQREELLATWEKHMRRIEQIGKETGKQAEPLRRSLEPLARWSKVTPVQLGPFIAPTSSSASLVSRARPMETWKTREGSRREEPRREYPPLPNSLLDRLFRHAHQILIIWILLMLVGLDESMRDRFYEIIGRERPARAYIRS